MKNKKLIIILSLVLVAICVGVGIFFLAPTGTPDPTGPNVSGEVVDYASSVKLDLSSPYKKQEVTVKLHIDGDTVHFNVPHSVNPTGVLKARFLAVNTPESTGKIEEWGKAASKFTRSKLESAVSIILESDDGRWNIDSTGERHLVWVWYKTAEDAEYRNLNIEILQEGYAISSNASQNRYGTYCTDAIAQADRKSVV